MFSELHINRRGSAGHSSFGGMAEMAKFDTESAYRLVPVHPEDRPLLGMAWKEKVYIDTAIPFGLRSAPKIFNAVADALQWIFRSQGVNSVLHYLDDFIVFGAPGTEECQAALDLALQLCCLLGVPIARHKTTTLVFLGIELDSVAMEIRLPREKLERLKREVVTRWRNRWSCSKKELLSLVGQLQHACCVVKAGRSFLRRMIDLASSVRELHHNIRLNNGFRSDLCWWTCFLPSSNGRGMMTGVIPTGVAGTMTSDASGSWGCGAFSSGGEWFQLQLPESWQGIHITVKELLPIVIGIALWGEQWCGRTVRCWCDNAAVVAILRSGCSKDVRVMHLTRSLFFFLAHYNLQVVGQHIPGAENGANTSQGQRMASQGQRMGPTHPRGREWHPRGREWGQHIPGAENGAADALSHNDRESFLMQVPSANKVPSVIPRELEEMLVTAGSWTGGPACFLGRV